MTTDQHHPTDETLATGEPDEATILPMAEVQDFSAGEDEVRTESEPALLTESNIESIEVEYQSEAPDLESTDESEATQADVVDADLAQLLQTPLGLRGAIEALLFSSPDPLPLARICRVLGVMDSKIVATLLAQLRFEYDDARRGYQILETVSGYQMATRELFGDMILRLRNRKRRPSLSPASLETLAIIAYRQPIIRAEIEAIRGVESGGTIRNLIDMNLVEMVGRKEVLGRPPMYGTSETFLQAFGLRNLTDLPSIGELKRRFGEEQAEAQKAEDQKAAEQHAVASAALLADPPAKPNAETPIANETETMATPTLAAIAADAALAVEAEYEATLEGGSDDQEREPGTTDEPTPTAKPAEEPETSITADREAPDGAEALPDDEADDLAIADPADEDEDEDRPAIESDGDEDDEIEVVVDDEGDDDDAEGDDDDDDDEDLEDDSDDDESSDEDDDDEEDESESGDDDDEDEELEEDDDDDEGDESDDDDEDEENEDDLDEDEDEEFDDDDQDEDDEIEEEDDDDAAADTPPDENPSNHPKDAVPGNGDKA